MQDAFALVEQGARTVHHDLGYRLVGKKHLERAEPQHRVNQGVGERFLLVDAHIEAPASLERRPANRSNLIARSLGIALGKRGDIVGGKLLTDPLLQPFEHLPARRRRRGGGLVSRRPNAIEERHGSTPSRRARLKENSPRDGVPGSSGTSTQFAASPTASPKSSLTLCAKGLRDEARS